jgi:hypothetical protein
MAGIHQFSARLIEYAERLDAVADAAAGKRHRDGRLARMMMLPASGAALYALIRSNLFSRRAKAALRDAKTFAGDLPDDLMAVVRQSADTVTGTQSRGPNGGRPSSRRKPAAARKKAPSRKPTSR